MKSKQERADELQELADAGEDLQLLKQWHRATGIPEGTMSDRLIGATRQHLIRDILDAEYPGDDSIPSGPQ